MSIGIINALQSTKLEGAPCAERPIYLGLLCFVNRTENDNTLAQNVAEVKV